MPVQVILPIGFIKELTNEGAAFKITDPEDEHLLRKDTPVTVWGYRSEQLAVAKVRGRVTKTNGSTAEFTTVKSEVDPRWPEDVNPLSEGSPVYLAKANSFEPDTKRVGSIDQLGEIQEFMDPNT